MRNLYIPLLAIIVVLITVSVGYVIYRNKTCIYPNTSTSVSENQNPQSFITQTLEDNPAYSVLDDFDPYSIYKTQFTNEWNSSTKYYVQHLSYDLRIVCVVLQDPNTHSVCDYTDYWTNSKSEKWERIVRDTAGTEGSAFCEYYEKWKVAKGAPCNSINGGMRFVGY